MSHVTPKAIHVTLDVNESCHRMSHVTVDVNESCHSKGNLNKRSLVTPRSTSNQSSKPCTVLQGGEDS